MRRLYLLSVFLFLLAANSAFSAPVSCIPGESAADPCRTAESNSHFTLPIGLPFSLSSSVDTGTATYKKDTASNKAIKGQSPSRKKIYQLNITDENSITAWRETEEAFRNAQDIHADFLLIHVDNGNAYNTMNRIRSKLCHYKTPVLLCIQNKTASSLIPLDKDSLKKLNSLRDASASKSGSRKNSPAITLNPAYNPGKKCLRNEEGAHFPTAQAIAPLTEMLRQAGIENADIIDYKSTAIDRLMDSLVNPCFSFFLLVMMAGGFYLVFRGLASGLPLFIAVSAALLFFASHYFEGLAQWHEIMLFITGLILLCADIYFTRHSMALFPGAVLFMLGITLSMCDTDVSILSLQFAGLVPYTLAALLLPWGCCLRMERHLFSKKLPGVQRQRELIVYPLVRPAPGFRV